MTTDETISVWGCVVCCHVLMQGDGFLDKVFAAMWLIFAACIFLESRRDRKKAQKRAEQSGDSADT